MAKMLILTDSETATGFRLAGVEVLEADQEGAQEALESAIESEDYGLVAVDQGLIPEPNSAASRVMRGRELPVLLSMPSLGAAFDEDEDPKDYMKSLVRSAIGFDIKLE